MNSVCEIQNILPQNKTKQNYLIGNLKVSNDNKIHLWIKVATSCLLSIVGACLKIGDVYSTSKRANMSAFACSMCLANRQESCVTWEHENENVWKINSIKHIYTIIWRRREVS